MAFLSSATRSSSDRARRAPSCSIAAAAAAAAACAAAAAAASASDGGGADHLVGAGAATGGDAAAVGCSFGRCARKSSFCTSLKSTAPEPSRSNRCQSASTSPGFVSMRSSDMARSNSARETSPSWSVSHRRNRSETLPLLAISCSMSPCWTRTDSRRLATSRRATRPRRCFWNVVAAARRRQAIIRKSIFARRHSRFRRSRRAKMCRKRTSSSHLRSPIRSLPTYRSLGASRRHPVV